MAIREKFHYVLMKYDPGKINEFGLPWTLGGMETAVRDCPQIFRQNGEPWLEANTYALRRLEDGIDVETANSFMNHLRDYAEFLEGRELDWRYFPLKMKNRCLFLYRGSLIERRDQGILSPSTANSRMSAVVAFYRWAINAGLIDADNTFVDKQVFLNDYNKVGLKRTYKIISSNLSIPNRKRPGESVEGGLTPLSDKSRKVLLNFLQQKK